MLPQKKATFLSEEGRLAKTQKGVFPDSGQFTDAFVVSFSFTRRCVKIRFAEFSYSYQRIELMSRYKLSMAYVGSFFRAWGMLE
jgi:hypothetical protein